MGSTSNDKAVGKRDIASGELTQQMKRELQSATWYGNHGSKLTSREGLACKEDKLYVPRSQVLQWSHNTKQAGHFGFLKTLHLVKRQF